MGRGIRYHRLGQANRVGLAIHGSWGVPCICKLNSSATHHRHFSCRWLLWTSHMASFQICFCHCVVPDVANTTVRAEICMTYYSRGVGEAAHIFKHITKLIQVFQNTTTNMREDPLSLKYCFKLPTGITDQIIASAPRQKMLQPGTPSTLADTMEMVSEFSEHTTSHPAITAMPVNYGANFVPHNTATVPKPIHLEPIHLAVANTKATGCNHSNGLGHEVHHCTPPVRLGNSQAFITSTGGMQIRWDCGRNCIDTCQDGPGTSATSAARIISCVKVATVKDTSTNNDGEDLTVEQEVGDEEDGQRNDNWE